MENLYNKLIENIDKTKVYRNEPMSKHTTFKIGGPADIFLKVETIDEMKYVIKTCKDNNVPLKVIGNGSNILVKDRRN